MLSCLSTILDGVDVDDESMSRVDEVPRGGGSRKKDRRNLFRSFEEVPVGSSRPRIVEVKNDSANDHPHDWIQTYPRKMSTCRRHKITSSVTSKT